MQSADIDFDGYNAEFLFGERKPNDGSRRERVRTVTDKPIVIIAGKQIELTETNEPSKLPWIDYPHRGTRRSMVVGTRSAGNYTNNADLNAKLTWYKAALGGVEIYITNGSAITVYDSITSGHNYDEYDGSAPLGEKSKSILYVVGSEIEAETLHVAGEMLLDNSLVETQGNAYLRNSKLGATRIDAKNQIDISESNVRSGTFNWNNTIHMNKCHIDTMQLSGFENIDLTQVRTYGEFRLHVGHYPSPGLSLTIEDISLTEFQGQMYNLDRVWNEAYGKERYISKRLTIKRRVDYGYFSGINPIPFVRAGQFDIATGTAIYKGSDVDPVAFPAAPVKQTYAPRPFYSLEPQPVAEPAWASTCRGGTLWEKARSEIFSNIVGEPTPIGKTGEGLINAFMEQLRSRISLYVELNSFAGS